MYEIKYDIHWFYDFSVFLTTKTRFEKRDIF